MYLLTRKNQIYCVHISEWPILGKQLPVYVQLVVLFPAYFVILCVLTWVFRVGHFGHCTSSWNDYKPLITLYINKDF